MTVKSLSPWFSMPLDDLRRSVRSITYGARTLPDAQLASELEQLRKIAADAPDDLAARLVVKVYADDQARRGDPEQSFDTEADVILTRLERQTNDADRQRLSDIGLALAGLGGGEALRAAYDRLLKRGDPKRRHVRESILQRRWGAIAPFMEKAA